jgi:putative transposase
MLRPVLFNGSEQMIDRFYETDLTDEQWRLVAPLLPAAKHGGRPRSANLRLIVNTILYLNKTHCQWRMLPTNLARPSTANGYYNIWKRNGTWQKVLDVLRQRMPIVALRQSKV